MPKVLLKDLTYTRSGDKGDISNIGLIAKDEKCWEIISREITPERVKQHFGQMVQGEVKVYPMPNIMALEVVCYKGLGGGATRTLRFDVTGKAMGTALQRMEIETD
ncbi:MAG: hypothetical protein APF81_24535 [Desulfosporosinus sp. BRH_c37]|nr:MAG: hypothetical protein APF81_24535 [Desulfosporosinus sp. BRH_c37]